MNKLRPVALLCAGPISRSALTRLPNLRRNLAWVKSSSYRVASRAVNALGAGVPVVDINAMKRSVIWIISVPHPDVGCALYEMQCSQIDWHGRILLILDSEVESDAAEWFRHRGAAVATFTPVDSEETRYVVEGDSEAVRMLRRLIEDPRARRVIEIKKGAKRQYISGIFAATQGILPHVAEAVECFQTAGIPNLEAKAITEVLLTNAMRSYFRAGRRALKS